MLLAYSNNIIYVISIIALITQGDFLTERNEEGVVQLRGHEIDIEKTVRVRRRQLVGFNGVLSGHHGGGFCSKGF